MNMQFFIALPITLILMACDQKPVVEPPSDFILGTPTLAGTATRGDSVRTVLLPDGKNIVFEIDNFVLDAGESKPSIVRKNLTLVVPFSVPAGYQVKFKSKPFSGRATLPEGAQLRLALETFFAGTGESKSELELAGALESSFKLEDSSMPDEEGFSACGADVNLRLNFSALLRTAPELAASASITHIGDEEGALEFEWKKCP